MDILYALEKIRTPFWNGVMSAVTQLGGEVIFIVAAVVVFWCVSKWEGYYLMTIAFCGTVLNQFLKLICRVPRPWVRDPNFTIVESARAEATGYSFPSGHTQNAIGLFGGMARWGGRRWVRLGLTALALVIAFSRMYLGVHTPADVGVSLVLAAALVLGLYPLMRRAQEKPRYMGYVLAAMLVVSGAFVVFVEAYGFSADTDAENLASGIGNVGASVRPGFDGLCFAPGDPAALAGAVRAMSAMQFDCTAIANATRRRFSAEENYKTLLKLYGRRAAEEVS